MTWLKQVNKGLQWCVIFLMSSSILIIHSSTYITFTSLLMVIVSLHQRHQWWSFWLVGTMLLRGNHVVQRWLYYSEMTTRIILVGDNHTRHSHRAVQTGWGISEGCHRLKKVTDWFVLMHSDISKYANLDFSDRWTQQRLLSCGSSASIKSRLSPNTTSYLSASVVSTPSASSSPAAS